MPILKKCCCSRNLRTGSIAAGVWTLIWSVLGIALDIYDLTDYDFPKVSDLEATFTWTIFIVSFVMFLCSVILMFGVIKAKPVLLVPWMLSVCISVLLGGTHVIYDVVDEGFPISNIIYLLAWIVSTLINVYSFLCVLSHYKELKAGRGTRVDYMGGHNGIVTAVQHVHIGEGPNDYIHSTQTIYSFHSQSLYDPPRPKCRPQELEMRVIGSAPNMALIRMNSTGKSMSMRQINSQPIIVDRRFINSSEKRGGRRKRTVSEGAKPDRFDDQFQERTTPGFTIGSPTVIEEEEPTTPTLSESGEGDRQPLTRSQSSSKFS